jgi:predicted nuclease with TOPRIM domain
MDQIPDFYQWLGGGALALLGLLLGNKVVETYVAHRLKKKDERDGIHQTNQKAVIDADVTAFTLITERLAKVEQRLDEMQEKNSTLTAGNARLEEQNKNLTETNQRQEKEIVRLRDDNRALNTRVEQLSLQIDLLTKQINQKEPAVSQ